MRARAATKRWFYRPARTLRAREVGTHRIAEIRVTKHIKPMIDGHADDVASLRKGGAIENPAGAGPV